MLIQEQISTENQPVNLYSKDYVWIVSYPKSGNTWIKFLLGNYLTNNNCDFTNVDLIIPEIYSNPQQIKKIKRQPVFVKSHEPFNNKYKKVIYIVRDSRDIAVSFFFYLKKTGYIEKAMNFEDFLFLFNRGKLLSNILKGITWSQHVNSWLDNAPKVFLLIRYEDVHQNPIKELERIVEFSGLNVDCDLIRQAVEASSFEKMQKLEKQQQKISTFLKNTDPSISFIRKGQPKDSENYFNSAMMQEFMNHHGYCLQRLGYIKDYIVTDSLRKSSMNVNLNKQSTSNQIVTTNLLDKLIKTNNDKSNIDSLNIIKQLESCYTYNNNNSKIFYLKALAEARLGYIDKAKNSLYLLLAKTPNHKKGKQLLQELSQETKVEVEVEVEGKLKQAVKYFNQGERIKALRLGEKMASLGVFIPGLHYWRSVFNSAVARYEEALEAAQQELKYNPTHVEAQQKVESLTQALVQPKKVKIPNEKRTWNTALTHDLMMSIQNSLHNYSYRGIPIQKNPFDFAIYPLLIWNLKPRTIIEIGSKSGGSALWFGDLLSNFNINGHVYSVDIVKVTKYSHSNVTFLEGDGQNLQEIFPSDFLKQLPRPLLVIEDADHSYQTSKKVLNFFHPYLERDEYIVVEDGIISDIVQDKTYSSGPHQALKNFLAEHKNDYDIDHEYCDFFAYNLTWATNGYLKKLTPAKLKPSITSTLSNSSIPKNKLPVSTKKWLNLGCGGYFSPDWTNIDFYSINEKVIAHNLLTGIPFSDNSFEVIYHSHLLEHLPKNEAEPFLRECYRVLKSNGIIRVVIPDLEQIARLYITSLEKALQGSKEDADNYDWLMLEMYDQVVRNESGGEMKRYLAQNPVPNKQFIIKRFGVEGEMLVEAFKARKFPYLSLAELNPTQIGQFRQGGEVHQWMYDRYSLGKLLQKVGFVNIQVCQANESRIPDFHNYYLDVLPDGRVRKSDSLFMEATKP